MISIDLFRIAFEKALAELSASAAVPVKYPFRSAEWLEFANRRRKKSPPLEKSVLIKGPKCWGDIPAWIESSGCTSLKSTRTAYARFWSGFTEEAEPGDPEKFAAQNTEARSDLALGVGSVRLPGKAAYHLQREKSYADNLRAFCERVSIGRDHEYTRFDIINYVFPPRRTGEVCSAVFSFGKSGKLNYYCPETDTAHFVLYKNSFTVNGDGGTTFNPPEVFKDFFARELPRLTPMRAFIQSPELISSIIDDVFLFIRKNTAPGSALNKFQKHPGKLGFAANDARRFYETVLVATVFNREECLMRQKFLSHSSDAANLHYRKTDMPIPEFLPLHSTHPPTETAAESPETR